MTTAVETIPISDRASWLQLRLQDLTASDIAAVVGLDPYRSPLRVYAEKTGLIAGAADNDIMRRGRWLEPAVIEAVREEHPAWEVRRAGVYLRNPAIRMGATPDAVAIDPEREGIGCVQCKVVSRPVFERDWPDGRAPLKFEIQTLAEAMLLDAAWAVVAALVIGTYSADLVIHEVPRHAGAEARIHDTVLDFWAAVDEGRQPAPIFMDDAEVIDALYPEQKAGLSRDFSADNRLPALLAERAECKDDIKSAEDRVKEIDAEIKAKLGEAEEGTLPGWHLSWKTQTRRSYVVAESTYRQLRVTDRREREGLAA